MLPPLPLPPLPRLRFTMKDREYADAAWELHKERGGGWIPEEDIQQRAKQIAARPKLPPLPRPTLPPLPVLPR